MISTRHNNEKECDKIAILWYNIPMVESKKISVLVPVYNVREYLPKCLDSLERQTYRNLEIIFVDDASTDGSADFVEKNLCRFANARLIRHEQNKNLFLTRISAMRECAGDYIICLDSDDYVDSDYYETLLSRMLETDADMCLGDFVLEGGKANIPRSIFNKESYLGEEIMEYLFFSRENRIYSVWNKMIRRDCFDAGLADLMKMVDGAEGINICEDNIFLFVFSYHAKKSVGSHGSEYHYVQHRNQSCTDFDRQKLIMQFESFDKATERIVAFFKSKGIFEKYKDHLYDRYMSIFSFLKHNALKIGISNDLDLKRYTDNRKSYMARFQPSPKFQNSILLGRSYIEKHKKIADIFKKKTDQTT